MYNQQFGKVGEAIATKYLISKKFNIIETNFFTKWGEIDIVAERDNRLHFIEVKTRATLRYGRPEQAVTRSKYQKAKRAVTIYLRQHPEHLQFIYQIDILAIIYSSYNNQARVRFFENILLK
ncbi:MAG: YraN family protein [Patescibacteria group bacterium]